MSKLNQTTLEQLCRIVSLAGDKLENEYPHDCFCGPGSDIVDVSRKVLDYIEKCIKRG